MSPPVDLLPGDTLELQVNFQNAQQLRLHDQALPASDAPNFAAFFSISPPAAAVPAAIEMEFLGVSGSLFVNPSIVNTNCQGGICDAQTPDLTNTSFDHDACIARLTPQGSPLTVTNVFIVWNAGTMTVEGPSLVDPPQTIPEDRVPLEYSNDIDETVDSFLGTTLEVHGAPDPGQTLYTEPIDVTGNLLPDDGLDVFPAVEVGTEITQQIDALAHGSDAYLADLFTGEADLLFSVTGDGDGREWALLREETDGAASVEYFHRDLVSEDAPGGLDDLDAAELWGDPGVPDARYYSLRSDVVSGTSVYVDIGGSPNPFVTYAEILAAVESLGYVGEPDQVDVDGIMVRNAGTETRFEEGDVLLFSIRATPDGNFDGGEIIELRPGQPAKFFEHGGHTWDTAFDLTALLNPLNGGVDPHGGEDVDALEATLASWLVGLVVGRVPDGSGPEPPLTVSRQPNGYLTLSWGASCAATDADYEIYEGTLGSYFSHAPRACSTAGLTSLTISPPAGSAYYLVVPTNGIDEGSYGLDSTSAERPPGTPSCEPTATPQCGP